MPRFDQTGPMGQGSTTGHKMGKCTNFGAGRNKDIPTGEVLDTQNHSEMPAKEGFGMRRGGRGKGMGRGAGQGNRRRGQL